MPVAMIHHVLRGTGELGGHFRLANLYEWLEANVEFDEHQRKITFDQKPRWVHAARGAVSQLKADGLLEHLGPGEYRFSEDGWSSYQQSTYAQD